MQRYLIKFLTPLLLVALLVACGGKDYKSHGVNLVEESELQAIYERDGYDEIYLVNKEGNEIWHDTIGSRDSIRFIVDSEIYAAALMELGVGEAIVGMFDTGYVTDPTLKSRINNGTIAGVGTTSSPNIEKILALRPTAIILSYYDGMNASNIETLGVPIVKMVDLQEGTPLGRAEWIRFLGRLVNRGEIADSIYFATREEYNRTKPTENNVPPKVLTELMYEGNWYVPGGTSYQARMIEDAGGDYFMKNDKSAGSVNLPVERVLEAANDADIWLIRYFGDENQLREILQSDPVYKEIKAYQEGNIYFSNTAESGLFREFPFHPELLLQDYSLIFRGDTSSSLRYFKRLELK